MNRESPNAPKKRLPLWAVGISFFLIEVFAFAFLNDFAQEVTAWPLAFGALWALLLTAIVALLPKKADRIVYGVCYFLMFAYAVVQTGYYLLFKEMMWLSEFHYASEGSDYFSVIWEYPLTWWVGIIALAALGVVCLCRFPQKGRLWWHRVIAGVLVAVSIGATTALPYAVFLHDREVKFAGSDYGRAQSAQAAYVNMFNTHRLYEVCGVYQTLSKDFYTNAIYPITPGYTKAQQEAKAQIDAYFAQRETGGTNELTGLYEGKNVVLVLMESMDDWMIGEHTPTINKLMAEGINFTNFYTPGYGGVRTFNSEFCLNTGSFLSSQGGYAFDYVTNDFRHSFANLLRSEGYSAKVYHYNDPDFYSRGVFSPAMGYEEYVCYADYVTEENEDDLYSDQFLFDYSEVADDFFRPGKKLNFVITRSAHLSYIYNELLSYWALKQYPEYRGLTGHEEEDCAYLKAKLVDDMFARLLEELEARGELEDTVIVAMTDHYTYGVEDQEMVMARSGVTDELLLEKTPCFIWSADGAAVQVDKTLNTSDLLPTVLNLLGVESAYPYIGRDAFDESYAGYVLFPDGSWICGDAAYNAGTEQMLYLTQEAAPVTEAFAAEMADTVNGFVRINNLILETNYYHMKK